VTPSPQSLFSIVLFRNEGEAKRKALPQKCSLHGIGQLESLDPARDVFRHLQMNRFDLFAQGRLSMLPSLIRTKAIIILIVLRHAAFFQSLEYQK
jgi:hypothetical protein